MREFKVGDIIKYPVFYKGFSVPQLGIIASERKQSVSRDLMVAFGYDVLNEKNEIVWVFEHNIEGGL